MSRAIPILPLLLLLLIACGNNDAPAPPPRAEPPPAPEPTPPPPPAPRVPPIRELTLDRDRACVATTAGAGMCWDESTAVAATPIEDAIAIAPGQHHTCAIRRGGRVACWGFATPGTMGDGVLEPPEEVSTPVDVPDLANITELSAGMRSTCALDQNGSVYCWGAAQVGVLGLGEDPAERCSAFIDRPAHDNFFAVRGCARPTPVELGPMAHIAVGDTHACALEAAGTVWCWGGAEFGRTGIPRREWKRCGNPRPICVPSPTQVPGVEDIVAIHSGQHTCAARRDGKLFCWGMRGAAIMPPTEIPGVAGVGMACAGITQTCVVEGGDRTVRCWPTESLYDGPQSATPIELGGPAIRIECGTTQACALREDGTVRCWLPSVGTAPPSVRPVPGLPDA